MYGGEFFTSRECIVGDRGDRVRKGNRRQTETVGKSIAANGGNGTGNGDRLQVSTGIAFHSSQIGGDSFHAGFKDQLSEVVSTTERTIVIIVSIIINTAGGQRSRDCQGRNLSTGNKTGS